MAGANRRRLPLPLCISLRSPHRESDGHIVAATLELRGPLPRVDRLGEAVVLVVARVGDENLSLLPIPRSFLPNGFPGRFSGKMSLPKMARRLVPPGEFE